MNSTFILRKPVISEKSMLGANTRNVYTFEVTPRATKQQIAEIVEKSFGVKVMHVRTTMIHQTGKRTGKKRLSQSGIAKKKAMVTLKAGQKIEAFDIQGQK
jgi:large subunit ribosomal protein L23